MRSRLELAFLGAVAWVSPAAAFDTPVHSQMTREVLSRIGVEKAAVEKAVYGNEKTDYDESLYNTMHAHFCNEEFAAGSNRLRTKMNEIVEALAQCDRERALDAIGTSLHAVQDFYAHSNAVNVYPNPKTTVDLFHLQDPGPEVICFPDHLPHQLTSAYWPDDVKVPGKCTHEQIAKDHPNDGPLFHVAKARAERATALYMQTVEEMARWALWDAGNRIQFLYLKQGHEHACVPAKKFRRPASSWQPHLLQFVKTLPDVVFQEPPKARPAPPHEAAPEAADTGESRAAK